VNAKKLFPLLDITTLSVEKFGFASLYSLYGGCPVSSRSAIRSPYTWEPGRNRKFKTNTSSVDSEQKKVGWSWEFCF
jgi:hypothetical protein